MSAIAIEGLSRRFAGHPALDGIDLDVADGEFVALLGPSGSGKTTLLRIIAGLDFADEGLIRVDGQDVSATPANRRRIGFVFQSHALFRHMTVAENVAFGLTVRERDRRPSRSEMSRRADELLALVDLGGTATRFPAELSGGERQRVALARALAIEPRILLLDEPFGALDAKVRKILRRRIRALHDRFGLTTILVTHDRDEALELADRVAVMRDGRIEQVATPRALHDEPASAFVDEVVNDANCITVTVANGQATFSGQPLDLDIDGLAGGAARLCFRPDQGRLVECGGIAAIVVASRQQGNQFKVTALAEDGGALEIDLPRAPRDGDRISVLPTCFRLFP